MRNAIFIKRVVLGAVVGMLPLLSVSATEQPASEALRLSITLDFIGVDDPDARFPSPSLGDHLSVKPGDDVLLRITYTNNGAAPLGVMSCGYNWLEEDPFGHPERILISRSDLVPVRKIKQANPHGWLQNECNAHLWHLASGESFNLTAKVNHLFDIHKPGLYKIRLYRLLDTFDGDMWPDTDEGWQMVHQSKHYAVSSNQADVEITP